MSDAPSTPRYTNDSAWGRQVTDWHLKQEKRTGLLVSLQIKYNANKMKTFAGQIVYYVEFNAALSCAASRGRYFKT